MITKLQQIRGWVGGIGLISLFGLFFAGVFTPPHLVHADPRDFLLQETDLPGHQNYSIPYSERHPISNERILYLLGDKLGQERIHKTGRISGWRVHFVRNPGLSEGPEDITAVVMQFASARGARLNLDTYSLSRVNPQEWQRLNVALDLGDHSLTETRTQTFANGTRQVTYEVNFTHNNMGVRIEVIGMEDRIFLQDALDLAAIVLRKLTRAELHKGPVPTPTFGLEPLEEGRAIYQ